jgi:hypothetical protein
MARPGPYRASRKSVFGPIDRPEPFTYTAASHF